MKMTFEVNTITELHSLKTLLSDLLSAGIPMSIDDLNMAVRTTKVLKSEGFETVPDLIQATEAELLKSDLIGKLTLSEIKNRLLEYGLSLRAEK